MVARTYLSVQRLTVILIWAVVVTYTPDANYASLAPETLDGFGIAHFAWALELSRFIAASPTYLYLLKYLTLAALVSAAWFPRRRLLIVVAASGAVVLDSLTKEIGAFANHAQIAPLIVLAVFATFSRICYLSPQELSQLLLSSHANRQMRFRQSVPPLSAPADDEANFVAWLTSLFLLLPYTFIGLNRVLTGGLDIFQHDAILDYIQVECQLFPSASCLAIGHFIDVPAVAWSLRVGFALITLLEVCSGLALTDRRFRLAWICVILLFHAIVALAMHIFFWENALLVAVFGLLDGPVVPSQLPARRTRRIPSGIAK